MTDRSEIVVEERAPGLYYVPGVTRDTVAQALSLYEQAGVLRAEEAEEQRQALLKAMIVAGLDPIPQATVNQARRLARQRERLLASGAYSIEALGRLRGDRSQSATRTWLSRQRARNALFTVEHDGTLLPAFELRADGTPRPGLQPVLTVLSDAGMAGWELWTWFTAGSSWLGGHSPEELLDKRGDATLDAARAFVSNLA